MSGVVLGAFAGIGFGLFQIVYRRVNATLDVYRATLGLLAVGTALLTTFSLITDDVRLLWDAPLSALGAFALAGFVHFFLGWTFLGLSQQRVGAARTSALVGAAPLFAAAAAALVLHEVLSVVRIIALLVVVAGVVVTSLSARGSTGSTSPLAGQGGVRLRGGCGRAVPAARETMTGVLCALATALCWSVSPLLIRGGLRGLPSPLLGVTVGMAAATVVYGAYVVGGRRPLRDPDMRSARAPLLVAGALVALAIWLQWQAYDVAPIGVVLAVMQVSAPVVVILAPLSSSDPVERSSGALWVGLGLVVAGSVTLLLQSNG